MPKNLKVFHWILLWCKKAKKENVVLHSCLLTSYLSCKLCTFLTESYYVMNIKVVHLTTKRIRIKPNTICISHRFELEVETSGFRGEDV